MKMLRILLKYFLVLQESEHLDSFKRSYKKERLNPYNPLSYIIILVLIIVGIFMYGFVGAWKELRLKDYFQWT
jgi:hypothetical protein